MMLKLQSVNGNQSSLRLFEDYDEFLQNDAICTETIEEGVTENDLCGENTDDVQIDTVDDLDDYAELYLEEYYSMEYYSQKGKNSTWTGDNSCPDDKIVFDEFEAYFYPYLDTDSSGLDLDGRKIVFLDDLAEIEDVDSDEITIDLGNKLYTFQDGDSFEYKDQDYDIDLTFREGGLYKIRVRED
jgi:hypothetical protein